jgi:hypothetical protein
MNHQHHIEELKKQIEIIKKEPFGNIFKKISKSMRVRNIRKKISSLEKELKKHHDKKTDTFL